MTKKRDPSTSQVITKHDRVLLQFTTARIITFYDSMLLHFTTGIAIRDKCNYNSQQVLQFTTLLHFTTAPTRVV